MVRKEPGDFGDRELAVVFVARKLKHALHIEEVFNAAGIDYVVEADRYSVGVLFRRERIGAFFYVRDESVQGARDLLRQHGFEPFDEHRQ